MATVNVEKEVLWRAQLDEFGCVNVQKVVRITDDEGEVQERFWRRAITPDDDFAALAAELNLGAGVTSRLQAIIDAARYPEAVQRFEERKAEAASQTGRAIG